MHILPAIDLFAGNAVRLRQGRYADVTVYSTDPPSIAREWRGKVPVLHVVDLQGARDGHAVQRDLVREVILAFGGDVQVGGGARTTDGVESYFELGAARVIVGTAAVRDPDLVRRVAERHPRQIVVALDAKDGKVAVEGWEQTSTLTALEVAGSLASAPIAALLYTDVSRDGTQVGPNIPATQVLASSVPFPVLASGGVGTLEHIRSLAKLPNVEGAIVGRALYERAFTLDDAILAGMRA
jgi:phosphoribosylformimino-5-aminoimidazole carboxamide ribotide isomerase